MQTSGITSVEELQLQVPTLLANNQIMLNIDIAFESDETPRLGKTELKQIIKKSFKK